MTRDEAITKARDAMSFLNRVATSYPSELVDALIALDILKVETRDDPTRIAAGNRLTGIFVTIQGGSDKAGWQNHGRLSCDGAFEVLDVLLKSGFKIVKDDSK